MYARHRQPLYRYVLHGCGTEHVARELAQDVWLRVIGAHETRSPGAPFRAWLFRIAHNRLIDHYRREPAAPHEPFEDDTLHTSPEGTSQRHRPLEPDEIAALTERGDALRRALAGLPVAQRDAIVLKHVAGMSLVEIAEVVGESTETVKSRVRYALVKLRARLKVIT